MVMNGEEGLECEVHVDGVCLVSHETLVVPVLMYGIETILWKKERSRIRAVQMDNLRGLLGTRVSQKLLALFVLLFVEQKMKVIFDLTPY